MASDGVSKRRKLFRLYAANLAHFSPTHQGQFACPLCLSFFTEDAICTDPPGVDIAHVYPESCGGKRHTMTCRRCNNRMGAKYDNQIARELKIWNAFGGEGKDRLNVRLRFQSGSMGAEIERTRDGFNIFAIKKQTDPKQQAKIIEEFAAGNIRFQFNQPTYDEQRLRVALLHSAYLALFRQFGYEYVLGAETKWLRDLFGQDTPPTDVPLYVLHIPKGGLQGMPLSTTLHSAGIVSTPTRTMFFAAAFPHPDPSKDVRLVLLPGAGEGALDQYREFKEVGKMQVRYHGIADAPEGRLADPDAQTFLREWWEELANCD